ncbi:hypothetical protein BKA82DRAFT_3925051, partial [Pisolithus tinctorius]
LRCRLYSTSRDRPQQVMMLMHCTGTSRASLCFPFVETLFQEAALQPYVHNCQVTVHEGRSTYHYCVFFKRHCRLQENAILSKVDDPFRGDVIV